MAEGAYERVEDFFSVSQKVLLTGHDNGADKTSGAGDSSYPGLGTVWVAHDGWLCMTCDSCVLDSLIPSTPALGPLLSSPSTFTQVLTSMSFPMPALFSKIHRRLQGHIQEQDLPPHTFQLANNAYYHMRCTAQD